MNYIDTYNKLYKKAGVADTLAVAVPGLATAGSLWWLSKYIPGVKKSKWLRGALAAAGGAGASGLMYKYVGDKDQALQDEKDRSSRAIGDLISKGEDLNNQLRETNHRLRLMKSMKLSPDQLETVDVYMEIEEPILKKIHAINDILTEDEEGY